MESLREIIDRVLPLLSYDPQAPMLFSSGLFLFLFAAFAFFYGFMRRTPALRIWYVIAFSLYFYYKSSGIYLLLLVGVSVSDFWIGRAIAHVGSRRAQRALVALSIAADLAVLGYFKYTNFFIEIARDLFGAGFLEFQNIFLPVGISFFLFQSLSYTIDIYRGSLKPVDRWGDYLFYLSFFPQLVAGPIVRARDFLVQIRQNPIAVSREMFGTGIYLITIGLFKKAVISDYISLNFVDRIFDDPALYSGMECLAAVYGYALQIYCDFSGYSDMAIGLALLLGFRFPKNFDAPYHSATITEFWRRWHISLSMWLRDYLYISLGGNRKGRLRTYFNLLVTMVLGGLWHGAAIRFVLWGTLHGVALALHKLWLSVVPGAKVSGYQMHPLSRLAGILVTFHLVCFGWLLFRADSMRTVQLMLHQITDNFHLQLLPQMLAGYGGVSWGWVICCTCSPAAPTPRHAARWSPRPSGCRCCCSPPWHGASCRSSRAASNPSSTSNSDPAMIPLYTFDHALFLALNFDGGPVMDRLMILVSGTAMWLPLYALILWLVWRREGWRRTLLFAAAIVLAIVLADMAAGIFKHSGPLKGLWADFPPRWRPMFTPSLEGLEIAPDTLMRWRFEGHATPGIVHVPEGALGGKFGTVSSHAATVVALLVLSAAEIRRRWFTFLMVAATLLICYSRIYLAKHFPVDLLLGAAVGALTGWAMLRAYRCIGRICRPPLPEKRRRRA